MKKAENPSLRTGPGPAAPASSDPVRKPALFPPRRLALLKWEARLALLLASVGWLVAIQAPARLWQSLAALFSLQFTDIVYRPTPFDNLESPFPVFPLLALAFWLQGALTLLWLNKRNQTETAEPEAQPTRSRRWFWPVAGVLLAAALVAGFLQRAAQLLPDSGGHLPASNYDEMVYFSGSALLAQGHLPYRDFFLAHPPGAELIYGLLLKLGGAQGGFDSFMLARWGSLALGLLATGLVFWVAGRLWASRSGFSLAAGTAGTLLYACDALASGVATLETPANLFAGLALGCYLEAGRANSFRARKLLWFLAGVTVALAMLCKLPGAALLFALVVYIILQRHWRSLMWLAGGWLAALLAVMGPLTLLAGPGETLRQVVFFQLLRPQEVAEGRDQIARLAASPGSALAIWLGGLALALLALRLLVARTKEGWPGWLIPALWSLPMLAVLVLNKSFHPWYYVQWALPLALLGAGLFSKTFWHPLAARLTSRWHFNPVFARRVGPLLAGAGLLLLLPLFAGQWQAAYQPNYDRVYRPAGATLRSDPRLDQPGLVFDPGYSFIAGLDPARLPFNQKYLVDSAGYMVYLNLDLDRTSLSGLVRQALGDRRERGQVAAIFQRDRAQALVVEAASGAGWAALDGKLALPELTPRSVEFIQTATGPGQPIDYVTLYPARPWPDRRPWLFDNGLWLTPFGLSSSVAGRANADPIQPGEVLRLSSAEAGQRTLDIRLVWRVKQNPARPVKVFVHLLDQAGNKVAQRDIAPLDGQADVRNWRTGDAYQDVHSLPLPSGLAPGRYRVDLGLYDAETGERIAVEGQASLSLGTLEVVK